MKKILKHPVTFTAVTLIIMILSIAMPSGHFPSKVQFADGTTGTADMYGKQLFLSNQSYPAGTFDKVTIRQDHGRLIAVCPIQMGIYGYVDAPLEPNTEQIQKWKYVFCKN
jgi:hypothetical protein